ncbi:hypothetical protein NDA01_07325 [Trichocoleus desertorum AS-A10]|uniref:hypothetical protein n=1 Tax=Trichocoleus desertorum TaxID=1481672 RepID=UPI003297A742
MSSHRRFEELIEERAKTIDGIRVTIERIRYLIDLIAKQIELEQQWSNANPDSRLNTARDDDQPLGNGA